MFDHDSVAIRDAFIIVDIDGTIADLTHRLHHIKGDGKPDWDAFHADAGADTPIRDIITLVRTLHYHEGVQPIMVTGRMGSQANRLIAEIWMTRHGVPCGTLFMRPEGDFRPDYEIKEEIFDNHLAEHAHKCLFALDDRDQMVKMWRRRGLRCLQVQNGNY